MIDTHTHLYLDKFDSDRERVITSAIEKGVKYMLLPNIDSSSIHHMLSLCDDFPENCFPMMGLHPTSVKNNYKKELEIINKWLVKKKFIAVGEIGIDLYWDKTYVAQQEAAFRFQIQLGIDHGLPLVIHSRNSMDKILDILKDYTDKGIRGVFHCFTGTAGQAAKIINMGFYLGIGGVLTFKNSGLSEVLDSIDLQHILLETDAPFLAPVPFRGKRNESAYILLVADKLAEVKKCSIEDVAKITTDNATTLFKWY